MPIYLLCFLVNFFTLTLLCFRIFLAFAALNLLAATTYTLIYLLFFQSQFFLIVHPTTLYLHIIQQSLGLFNIRLLLCIL